MESPHAPAPVVHHAAAARAARQPSLRRSEARLLDDREWSPAAARMVAAIATTTAMQGTKPFVRKATGLKPRSIAVLLSLVL